MYAIIEVGAKQYLVKKDDILEVDKQLVQEGKEVVLGKVILVSKDKKIEVGQPYLTQAKVKGLVLKQTKGPKVISFKYRRRKSSHWKKGFRSRLTRFKVTAIEVG